MQINFVKLRQRIQERKNLATCTQNLLNRRAVSWVSVLEWGDLRFNQTTFEATYADQPIDLTAKECRLLEMFLYNERRVLTRSEILERLWYQEKAPSIDTVKAHINHLRQKLQAVGAPRDLIETIYGVGYRLKAKP